MFKTRRIFCIGICILLVSLVSGLFAQKVTTRKIKDMDDRVVEVPVDPQRIACLHYISNERVITLGKGGSITMMMMVPSPWMAKYYPELKKDIIHTMPGASSNLELMLEKKIDLTIYAPFPGEAEKYRAAGLSTVCGYAEQKGPRNIQGYMENFKRQYTFFGDLLGPAAKQMSEKYCKYYDAKLGKILAITSKINNSDRPTVYYGGAGGDVLTKSFGKDSALGWLVEIAGGKYLPFALNTYFASTNVEQLLSWNPEIILVGGYAHDSVEKVKKDNTWKTLRAVKNNKVYPVPNGITSWEHVSGESVLLAIYMAKLLHPEQFKDWNMINEMTTFYSEIYGKKVTAQDAERILKCLPPIN